MEGGLLANGQGEGRLAGLAGPQKDHCWRMAKQFIQMGREVVTQNTYVIMENDSIITRFLKRHCRGRPISRAALWKTANSGGAVRWEPGLGMNPIPLGLQRRGWNHNHPGRARGRLLLHGFRRWRRGQGLGSASSSGIEAWMATWNHAPKGSGADFLSSLGDVKEPCAPTTTDFVHLRGRGGADGLTKFQAKAG